LFAGISATQVLREACEVLNKGDVGRKWAVEGFKGFDDLEGEIIIGIKIDEFWIIKVVSQVELCLGDQGDELLLASKRGSPSQ
jgi:hypothetical protein